MSSVYSLDDVAYRMHKTAGHIVSASEYGRDMYDNTLEKRSSNTTLCEETILRVLGT